MVKVKDLPFDQFQFNENRRSLCAKKHYINNKKQKVNMTIQLHAYNNGVEIVFSVRIAFSCLNQFKEQFALFSAKGIQEPRLNQLAKDKLFDNDKNNKLSIDKRYEPMIRKIIALYKEVNQDMFIDINY